MNNWTCTQCGRTIPISIAVVPPIRCACGFIDRDPVLENYKIDPPPTPLSDEEQAAISKELAKRTATQGRAAWSALHAYPTNHAHDWYWATAQVWYLTEWLPMVPRYCECQAHWQEITKKLPPDFETAEAFYQWSVAAHNAVNARLGKPIWTGATTHEQGND